MDAIPTSKRSETAPRVAIAAIAIGVLGCGASGVPSTAASFPDAPRQPDGVVIETSAALPSVEERASASGVVALRPPLGGEAVITVVHRFFRAFSRDDADGLQAILTDDATMLSTASSSSSHASRGKGPLLDQLRARVKNPAYARLAGAPLVEEERIERFTYDDLGVPGAPERPQGMRPGELLVRFPVETPRVGSEQLFGDAMTLLLRREGRTYRIAGMGEENGP